jgi:hypothetical protein
LDKARKFVCEKCVRNKFDNRGSIVTGIERE